MKKALIAIDRWKLTTFGKHLSLAGYAFETTPGLTSDTLHLFVNTDDLIALELVVRKANTAAAKEKLH